MPPGFKQGAPCLGNHLLFTTVAIHGLRHALFPIHRRLARPVSSLSSICVRRRQRQLPLLLSHYATKERIREKERAAAASRQLFDKQKGGRRLRCAKLIKDVFTGSYRFHATRRLSTQHKSSLLNISVCTYIQDGGRKNAIQDRFINRSASTGPISRSAYSNVPM